MTPEEPRAARRAAVALLSRRAYGACELAGKLLDKGFPAAEAEDAAEWLLSLGYLNDEDYAREGARTYAAKGYGYYRVRRELLARQLDGELVERVLEEELPEAGEAVDALVARLSAGRALDESGRRRLAGALYRRGFGWEEIRAALARAFEED